MNRLKTEIEACRKEQAEVKDKHKWAMDTWVRLSKELTSMTPNNPELKKKEKDCENQSQLVKQLADALAKVDANLDRLNHNLFFFFEENMMEGMDIPSASSKKKATATSSSASVAEDAASVRADSKEKSDQPVDSKLNAFRKHILGYCHGSHGVSDNIQDWKEKLPTLLGRAEKKLPADKAKSFRYIIENMSSIGDTRKKLILWYVDMFPSERKPQGYYEAAGLPVPKKKVPGEKKEEEEEVVSPVKPKSASKKKEEATSEKTKSKDKVKPKKVESSSSSDDESTEEERSPKKMKLSEFKKKEETPAPKKKDSSFAMESSKKKKAKKEEEEPEEEEPKKKHHHKKSSSMSGEAFEAAAGKASRKSKA